MKPTAYNLARVLQRLFAAQAREARQRLTVDTDYDPMYWVWHMANTLRPIVLGVWQEGMQRSQARQVVRISEGGREGFRRHTPGNDAIFGREKSVGTGHGARGDPATGYALILTKHSVRPVITKTKAPASTLELFDPRVLDVVDELTLRFCRETMETARLAANEARDAVRRLLKAGLAKGVADRLLAARMRRIFADPARALRIATTETARARHGGRFMAAAESGVVRGKVWNASVNACPQCQEIDGKEVKLNQPFIVLPGGGPYARVMYPPLHPYCLLPETPVIAPTAMMCTMAQYDGPAVRFYLTGGRHISVTTHHLLLTPEGFSPASALVDGDDVLCDRVGEAMAGRDPHDDRQPPRVEQVFNAWAESCSMPIARVPVAPEYLHGDARFCDGHIDVVPANGLQWDDIKAHTSQPAGHRLLGRARDLAPMFDAEGYPTSVLFALAAALDGGYHTRREASARLRGHSRVPGARCLVGVSDADASPHQSGNDGPTAQTVFPRQGQHGGTPDVISDYCRVVNVPSLQNGQFGLGSEPDPERSQPVFDGVRTDAARISDVAERFPGRIAACKIVKVERFHYRGPVYDISTRTSLYILPRGVISSNCYCDWSEVL